MIKLSLIIPIYNTEKYLDECLNILSNQINSSVEVICINDGSTDKSYQKLEKIHQTLPTSIQKQIILINQSNQGVSKTRNLGISLARGEYIGFLDSDDFSEINYIESVLKSLETQADLILFNAQCIFEHNSKLNYALDNSDIPVGFHVLDDSIRKIIFSKNNWFSWLKVYKKSLISHQKFPEDFSHFEDTYFVSQALISANSICGINEILYNYRIIDNSATRSKDIAVKLKLIKSTENLMDYFLAELQNNPLFAIPLLHFFNIYIEESKKSLPKHQVRLNWYKYAPLIHRRRILPNLIKSDRERYLLYCLNMGYMGHYLSKKIFKILKIFRNKT